MPNKYKTIKSINKRFKITNRGKVLKRHAGQDHLNAKESGRITRHKRRDLSLSESCGKVIKRIMSS